MRITKDSVSPYVREKADRISVGNGNIEIGFSRKKNGALLSILEKETGYELRRNQQAPTLLWKLALRSQTDKEIVWVTSDEAREFRSQKQQTKSAVTLILTTSGFKQPGLMVTVKISLSRVIY